MLFVKYLVDHLLLLLVIHHSPMQWGCWRHLEISVCVNHMPKRMPLRPHSTEWGFKIIGVFIIPTSAFFSLGHCQERHAYRFSYRSRKFHRCHLSFITRQRKILPIWAESTHRIRQLINQSTEIAHRPILLTQFTEVCRKVRKTRCRQRGAAVFLRCCPCTYWWREAELT